MSYSAHHTSIFISFGLFQRLAKAMKPGYTLLVDTHLTENAPIRVHLSVVDKHSHNVFDFEMEQ